MAVSSSSGDWSFLSTLDSEYESREESNQLPDGKLVEIEGDIGTVSLAEGGRERTLSIALTGTNSMGLSERGIWHSTELDREALEQLYAFLGNYLNTNL